MVREDVLALALGRRGFSFIELVVTIAILALATAISMPSLLTYWSSATLRAAAEELAAGLNRGRQLAIAQGRSVCVEIVSGQYRYRTSPPGGGSACTSVDIWSGPGAGANGFFRLANNVAFTANANPVFDYLGAATPGATFTVTPPQGSATLKVVVSVSGRVQITH